MLRWVDQNLESLISEWHQNWNDDNLQPREIDDRRPRVLKIQGHKEAKGNQEIAWFSSCWWVRARLISK